VNEYTDELLQATGVLALVYGLVIAGLQELAENHQIISVPI
jgi:hypothetical protein